MNNRVSCWENGTNSKNWYLGSGLEISKEMRKWGSETIAAVVSCPLGHAQMFSQTVDIIMYIFKKGPEWICPSWNHFIIFPVFATAHCAQCSMLEKRRAFKGVAQTEDLWLCDCFDQSW